MKEFFKVMRRYVAPYKRYMIGSLIFNLLSAVLSVFSFASLIPMLNLLFKVDKTVYGRTSWSITCIITPSRSCRPLVLQPPCS